MTEIEEGDLTFTFPDDCEVDKYDEWSFYRNQFQPVAGGSKAVDILCVSGDAAWLIEIKDYRQHPRTKPSDIGDELASKVRDTLAGLAAASSNANSRDERALARRALQRRRWRVVLHLRTAEHQIGTLAAALQCRERIVESTQEVEGGRRTSPDPGSGGDGSGDEASRRTLDRSIVRDNGPPITPRSVR